MKTRTLTVLSVAAALQVVLLLAALILPTVKISMLFAASIISGILCAGGYKKMHVLLSFAAASILSLVLISNYIIPISYIMFFGAYGIVHFITKPKKLIIKELIRFIYLFAAICVLYFVFKSMVINSQLLSVPYVYFVPAAVILGYVIFQILYDKVVQEFFKNRYLSDLISEKK
ncbi:MAG: hypothetical protein AB1Z23_11405 [Eubacteriales bacterium]